MCLLVDELTGGGEKQQHAQVHGKEDGEAGGAALTTGHLAPPLHGHLTTNPSKPLRGLLGQF